jgi:hypothetical protein
MGAVSHRPPVPPDDPVRARRAQIAHWTLLANRIGYLLFAVAMALFVLAFVLGYAVKAAEKEDRARGL